MIWKSKQQRGRRSRSEVIRRARSPERLETRRLLSADAIHVGVVYLETDYLESDQDVGSDSRGDRFILSFSGGAPGTQLSELRIRTDKDGDGLSVGDSIFDTLVGGRGKEGAHGFQVVRVRTSDGHSVDAVAEVQDGGQELVLRLANFRAGDRLEFTIDVDEIIRNSIDLAIFNDRLDVITSGQEFQDSILDATFEAPHYETSHADAIFTNNYGDPASLHGLALPPDQGDDVDSRPNRSAGAVASTAQTPKPVEISGHVWIDNDLDGIREASEAGLAGVELSLWQLSSSGSYQDSGQRAVSDASGTYLFSKSLGLMPGTYRLVQQQPEGLVSVAAVAGFTGGVVNGVVESVDIIRDIRLPLGDTTSINHDFAEAAPAALSGYVYRDLDNDARRDAGESGVAGVRVRLVPVSTIAPQTSWTVTTGSDGSYRFDDLAPGSYEVIEVDQPADLVDGTDTPGTVSGRQVGIAQNPGDRIHSITLAGADVGIEYNFAELPFGSLAGHVFLAPPGDVCNGEHEAEGGRPLAGVQLELQNEFGETVARTATLSDGSYSFTRVPIGLYQIVEITPDGLVDGSSHVGTIGGNSVGTSVGGGRIRNIAMIPAGLGADYDFCEGTAASIGGRVYHDASHNGHVDPGEGPIPGVTIELIGAQGEVIATEQTDAEGRYRFDDVRPGVYTLREQQPAGYLDGVDTAGTVRGETTGRSDGIDSLTAIDLKQGDVGVDYNFGERLPASLSGRVWVESDLNQRFDADEIPLPEVLIELLDAGGTVVGQTRTASSGEYQFAVLTPGVYSVRQRQPDGLFHGGELIGTAGGYVADDNLIAGIELLGGTTAAEYDFPEIPPAAISGFVFQDGETLTLRGAPEPSRLREYQDGQRSDDDRGLTGVVLELRDQAGRPIESSAALPGTYTSGAIRVVTDALGHYAFAGLPPGIYHVYQVQPADYVDGLDTPGAVGAVAVNRADPLDDSQRLLLERLRQDESTDPHDDAILNIALVGGVESSNHNFSELVIVAPVDPVVVPPEPLAVPEMTVIPSHVEDFDSPIRVVSFATPVGLTSSLDPYRMLWDAMDDGAVSWHLSVINGGYPRGVIVDQGNVHSVSMLAILPAWNEGTHARGRWTFNTMTESGESLPVITLGEHAATALAGDFDGDGSDEAVIFVAGQWYVDLNGNGRWDAGDLWIQLGNSFDRPVIGDWDGDGKDDIAIFGNQWERDPQRIIRDPGLPDPANVRRRTMARPVSLTGRRAVVDVPRDARGDDPQRLLRRGTEGILRADAVDHVFQYGDQPDTPVAGDWNGDGIDQIGVFRHGHWTLDADGDGRFADSDERVEFGQPGDIPIVGDFDGDKIDEIGVVRGDLWIIDTDGDRRLTGNDLQIEVPRSGENSQPVVGDFDGDGKDEPCYYDEAA